MVDYKINFDALANAYIEGISIRGSCQGSDIKVLIDESIPNHFVQILFLLKEEFSDQNGVIRWRSFTKDEIIRCVVRDEYIYTDPDNEFGVNFYNDFYQAIETFLENYCVVSSNNKRKAPEISK